MPDHTFQAAIEYAERGWAIFPLKPGDKRPRFGGWQDYATTSARWLRKWWGENGVYRDSGIGLLTGERSGIVVLDVDTGDGEPGPESLANLEGEHGPLPPTLRQRTPSGGTHYLFRYPTNLGERTIGSPTAVRPGLDVRGEGGLIVLAPSVAARGAYEWLPGPSGPAELPYWLLELMLASSPLPRRDRGGEEVDRDLTPWETPPEEYVPVLCREGGNGKYHCPNPGHADSDASLVVHYAPAGAFCYGCRTRVRAMQLGAMLLGLGEKRGGSWYIGDLPDVLRDAVYVYLRGHGVSPRSKRHLNVDRVAAAESVLRGLGVRP